MSGKSAFGGALVLLAVAMTAPAAASGVVPLAQVARDLGFRYAYLDEENGVSLTRDGAVIVVRPGQGFFTINNRREPVFGTVPFYRDNDVVVSRAFEQEIKPFGAPRSAGKFKRATVSSVVRQPVAVARADPGRVLSVGGFFVIAADSVEIAGRATPGTPVTLVLRADLSQDLPVVTLDEASVVADQSGAFAARLRIAPDHFGYTRLFVEATAPGSEAPITAHLDGVRVNRDAHTQADEALTH